MSFKSNLTLLVKVILVVGSKFEFKLTNNYFSAIILLEKALHELHQYKVSAISLYRKILSVSSLMNAGMTTHDFGVSTESCQETASVSDL